MESIKTILIADDEKEIRNLLRVYLEKDEYNVLEAENGKEALEKLANEKVDLLLLDIMMPEMDGIEVLKTIRENNNIPILILSSKSGDYDRILGLDLGADDYIMKPFNPLEVVSRVSANIRRFYKLGSAVPNSEANIVHGDLSLNTAECVLYHQGERIELTSTEYKILKLLMSNPGRVYTKQQIYEAGWEEQSVIDDNSIMVSMSKIRAKLKDTGNQYITTIRGLGYRFEK